MNKINSLKNINQQSDLNKPESNQDSSSQKISNSKLLESLQAQSQSLRGQAEASKEVKSSKIQDRTEYIKDFNTSSKSAQDSSDESLNQFQKSLELDSSSFFKKMEARMLKEEAKTQPREIAEDLKMRAKEKLKESVVDSKDSRKADNKSQDELFNSQTSQFDASNSQDQTRIAESEINQLENNANTALGEASKISSKGSSLNRVTGNQSTNNGSTGNINNRILGKNLAGNQANNNLNVNNLNAVNNVIKNGRIVGQNLPGNIGNAQQNSSNPTQSGRGAFINKWELDGSNFAPTGNRFLDMAKSKLAQVMKATVRAALGIHPVTQINKFMTHKSLGEEANKYLDAANIDASLNDSQLSKQAIIFTKAQANNVVGDANTGIAYWQQNQQGNKEGQNKTGEMIKPVA